MGTLFTITLYARDKTNAQIAARAAFQRISDLDDLMSDYQADSELMRLCDQPSCTPVQVSADLFQVLEKAQHFSRLSEGAFDVTVGPYVRLWRFARKKKILPTTGELRSAADSVGFEKLRLDGKKRTATLLVPGMRLDLGGIAKGYAADQALKSLQEQGIRRALVAASGDIAFGDPPPGQPGWSAGITTIDERSNRASRSIFLSHAGISTSGDTEQFVEIDSVRYSHIVDPHSGMGLTNRIQATVVARDATTTDALATALCVLGVKRSLALVDSIPDAAALILTREGEQIRAFPSRRFGAFTEALGNRKSHSTPQPTSP